MQFRNSEDVLHNVRVTDARVTAPVFNVATVAFGKYEHKFDPGLLQRHVRYSPDHARQHSRDRLAIHGDHCEPTAAFSIPNVRAGQYNLTVYAGAAPVVRPIEVKDGKTELGVIQ